MNLFIKNRNVNLFLALSTALLYFCSCSKSEDTDPETKRPIVTIALTGVENEEEISSRSLDKEEEENQEFILPFDEDIAVYATLTKIPNIMSKATETTALASGIKYSLVIYDQSGNLVKQENYTHDPSTQRKIENLNVGEAYTFILYSVNSTSSLPTITDESKLSTSKLSAISEDLMFFKGQLNIKEGENKLTAVLKHKFSLITSTIKVDDSIGGKIESITAPIIKPTCQSANLKFSDEEISYNSINENGATVFFSNATENMASVTSDPTLLIHSETTAATYEIPSITVNGSTNSVKLDGQQAIKIIPGYKYNLTLNFKIPCTESVSTNGRFDVDASEDAQTITAPGANYGFTFDIYYLDNSFQMEINGTNIAKKEIQFEIPDDRKFDPQQNIKFVDGDRWEKNGIPGIWVFNRKVDEHPVKQLNAPDKPVVRVQIDSKGNISMFAVKKDPSIDPHLYPLELWNGNSFNTITWYPDKNNTVVINQRNINITQMIGYGYGKKIVTCK